MSLPQATQFRSRRATGGLLQDGAAPQRRAVRYLIWPIVVGRVEDGLGVPRSTAAVKPG
jgi:hypothetical protein